MNSRLIFTALAIVAATGRALADELPDEVQGTWIRVATRCSSTGGASDAEIARFAQVSDERMPIRARLTLTENWFQASLYASAACAKDPKIARAEATDEQFIKCDQAQDVNEGRVSAMLAERILQFDADQDKNSGNRWGRSLLATPYDFKHGVLILRERSGFPCKGSDDWWTYWRPIPTS